MLLMNIIKDNHINLLIYCIAKISAIESTHIPISLRNGIQLEQAKILVFIYKMNRSLHSRLRQK